MNFQFLVQNIGVQTPFTTHYGVLHLVTSIVSRHSLVLLDVSVGYQYSLNFVLVSILVVSFYFTSSHISPFIFLDFHSFV